MQKRTKVIAIIAASVILAGTATGAFAYWAASGSGTGTALTGSGPVALTVNQTTVLNPMSPGDAAQTLSGTFTNTGVPSYVDDVVVSISDVNGTGAGNCDATDFTLTGATMVVNHEIASGASVGSWTGATIRFNDKADSNQSDCEGATVTLSYTID